MAAPRVGFFERIDLQLARLTERQFYLGAVIVVSLVAAALVSLVALYMSRNFLVLAADTAAFRSALVNTLDGRWFRDTAYDGPNLLGLHGAFVLLLIAPVYAVFPSLGTLVVLQVALVYLTLIPLYLVAVDILGRPLLAFLVATAALCGPFLFQMALALFHPETWMLAALLWSYHFYRNGRLTGFWISLLLGLSCGEQAGLLYAALGLSLLLVDDGVAWRRNYGLRALGAGVVWLAICFGVVFPLMRHPEQRNLFAYNYSDWTMNATGPDRAPGSPVELFGALAHIPLTAVLSLLRWDRWGHLLELVGLPLVLALLSWRALLLLAPFPLYFLMNDPEFNMPLHVYYFQFAFLAGYLGFLFFLPRWNASTRLGIAVLTGTFVLNGALLCARVGEMGQLAAVTDDALNLDVRRQFASIPLDAGIFGPHRYSAYLSAHPNMILADLPDEKTSFDDYVRERIPITGVSPAQVDYIISDLENDQCGWRQYGQGEEPFKRRSDEIQRLLDTKQWQTFWSEDNVIILKRVTY